MSEWAGVNSTYIIEEQVSEKRAMGWSFNEVRPTAEVLCEPLLSSEVAGSCDVNIDVLVPGLDRGIRVVWWLPGWFKILYFEF